MKHRNKEKEICLVDVKETLLLGNIRKGGCISQDIFLYVLFVFFAYCVCLPEVFSILGV